MVVISHKCGLGDVCHPNPWFMVTIPKLNIRKNYGTPKVSQ